MIKKILKKVVARLGYRLEPLHSTPPKNWFTMERALHRASNLFPNIATVIDVGASDGRWSRECMRSFKDAAYLLVEAQEAHLAGLNKFKSEFAHGDYVMAVAGATDGTILFDDSELFGGQAYSEGEGKNLKELPQISLDKEIERRALAGPYILKLDTHGFEVPILEGANRLLSDTELLIVESYNFKLTDTSLRYWEMCQYLDKLGFAPIENVDLMLREKDHVFWQMDTFFIKKNHSIFEYNKYE
ncbi:MAG: FkbM family methyltransferase [Gilvibacter sp.]